MKTEVYDIKGMTCASCLSLIHILGSADWMPRNLDKRVEIIFPVEDGKLKKEAKHILDIQLGDNVKARILKEDGTCLLYTSRCV